MEISRIHTYKAGSPESIERIRSAQNEHKFIIPSDFVYFLLKYNNLRFFNTPMVIVADEELVFNEFYNLELIVWEILHYRSMRTNYGSNFWLNNFLSVGNIDRHRVLIGIKEENVNKVFLHDDEEGNVFEFSNDIFEFINDKLFYPTGYSMKTR